MMIKILGVLNLFIFSQFCFANWSLHRRYDDISIYKSKKGTRLTLSSRSTKTKDKKFTKAFLEEIKKDKEKMLTMIGVKDWRIATTKVETKDGVTKVRLQGSYYDTTKQRIHFIEYHYYSNDKKLQLLLTNRKKHLLKIDANVSNIKGFWDEYRI